MNYFKISLLIILNNLCRNQSNIIHCFCVDNLYSYLLVASLAYIDHCCQWWCVLTLLSFHLLQALRWPRKWLLAVLRLKLKMLPLLLLSLIRASRLIIVHGIESSFITCFQIQLTCLTSINSHRFIQNFVFLFYYSYRRKTRNRTHLIFLILICICKQRWRSLNRFTWRNWCVYLAICLVILILTIVLIWHAG